MAKKKAKKIVKNSSEKVSTRLKNKETRQLYWLFGSIAVVFLIFLGTYFYVDGLKKFEFGGIDWVREDYSDLTVYHSRFSIEHSDMTSTIFNLYFRNDPRKNGIFSNANVSFYPEVVISQSEDVYACEDSILVSSNLAQIGSMFPFIVNVTGAMNTVEEAGKWGVPFADCSNSTEEKTILLVEKVDGESAVVQDESYPDCYHLQISSCDEALLVQERFMLDIISKIIR